MRVLVAQSCPTLCDPVDCSPPVSSVHGISQARILEWVAISFSSGSSRPRGRTHLSCVAGGFFEPGKLFCKCLFLSNQVTVEGWQCPWSFLFYKQVNELPYWVAHLNTGGVFVKLQDLWWWGPNKHNILLFKIGRNVKDYQDKKMTDCRVLQCWAMVIVRFISAAVMIPCFESLQVFTGDSRWGGAAFGSLACPCWWRPYWHNNLQSLSRSFDNMMKAKESLRRKRFTHISCAYCLGVVMTSQNLFLDLRVGN